MKQIALAYSDTIFTELDFDEDLTEQQLFETIKLTDPIIATTRVQGTLLNGRVYDHKLYTRKFIEVTISSNEITTAILSFLQAFWDSNFKYISINTEDPIYSTFEYADYIQVYTDSGDFPVEYNEDIKYLPEVTFKLYYVEVE